MIPSVFVHRTMDIIPIAKGLFKANRLLPSALAFSARSELALLTGKETTSAFGRRDCGLDFEVVDRQPSSKCK